LSVLLSEVDFHLERLVDDYRILQLWQVDSPLLQGATALPLLYLPPF